MYMAGPGVRVTKQFFSGTDRKNIDFRFSGSKRYFSIYL